jgi:hypothetical protein
VDENRKIVQAAVAELYGHAVPSDEHEQNNIANKIAKKWGLKEEGGSRNSEYEQFIVEWNNWLNGDINPKLIYIEIQANTASDFKLDQCDILPYIVGNMIVYFAGYWLRDDKSIDYEKIISDVKEYLNK